MEEFKEKLEKADAEALKSSVEKLKTAHGGSNLEDIKSAMDEVNQGWNQIAAKMYDATKDQAPPQEPADSSSDEKKEGEIEDADFEVVK